jgi:hypothetical protein
LFYTPAVCKKRGKVSQHACSLIYERQKHADQEPAQPLTNPAYSTYVHHASYSYSACSTPANTVAEAALVDPSLASKYERRSDVIGFSWVPLPSFSAGSLLSADKGSPRAPVFSLPLSPGTWLTWVTWESSASLGRSVDGRHRRANESHDPDPRGGFSGETLAQRSLRESSSPVGTSSHLRRLTAQVPGE